MNKFNTNHKIALDKLLLRVPGITAGKAFGYPAYNFNGKLFAFVETISVVLRLPNGRISQLAGANAAMHAFEPVEGMIWNEWVSIQRMQSADYWQDLGLFEEAARFVTGREVSFRAASKPARKVRTRV